jgi:periplasmic protein TonB
MQAITHPGTATPARKRHFITVALVGALHIAAIYAILVALDIVPPPTSDPQYYFRVVPSIRPKPATQSPVGPIVLAKASQPTEPRKPTFQIDQNPVGGTNIWPGPTDSFVLASPLGGTHTTPDYPVLDRRLDHQGTVRLALQIDALGVVTGASVEKSSGYDGLDAAAIDWVKAHWRYKPAMQNGTAMPTTTQASVVFRLTQAPL